MAYAFYAPYHRFGKWRKTYLLTCLVAQYLNTFVLIVQMFQKIPFLKAVAPTQSEAPFAITQLLLLILFVVLGFLAVKKTGQS